jgi:hypothetical protein
MKRFFTAIVRLVLTGFCLWLALVVIRALVQLPVNLDRRRVVLPLGLGFGAGLGFFLLISRMIFLYVVGHELTHWLMAKVFRRRTGKLRVGLGNGSVAIERPNIWITLAPYFIPVYALMGVGVYGLVDMFWRTEPAWMRSLLIALIGAAYAFHVVLTISALRRAQSDVRMHGRPLSLSLILLCNLVVILLALMVATGQWGEACRLVTGVVRDDAAMLYRLIRALLSALSPKP